MPLDLLCDLMAKAAGRAAYAEARWVDTDSEDLRVRNGRVDELDRTRATGLGVRVRVGGGWGFAASRDVSPAGAEAALARALALAQAQPAGAARPLAALDGPAQGHWASPCERDPLAVSLEDKLALLLEADAALRADARVAVALSSVHARRVDKAFASTDGAACTQTVVQCGGGVQALAVDAATGEAQGRSYPTSHGGLVAQAGWEHVLALDLVAHAARVGAEAVELLTAPPCPEATTDLVLHPEQVALQVHESIGHALELDRILLGEASYAGESWVTEDRLGGLRYGSEQLTVTADATLPGGLGSFGWDDEGVAAARTELIVAGELRGTLSNRESAAAVGLARSGGCARAEGFARQPIVRMTNVSIEPGDAGSLADLIAATERGLYLESNRSWSIDDRRLQFQFATEVAREIRGGELGRLYRNPVYAGVTPRFWGSLDAVGGAAAWSLWGLTNCGKGEPGQVMEVSHGAAPARFRDVQVRPAA
jgi:TldD protein